MGLKGRLEKVSIGRWRLGDRRDRMLAAAGAGFLLDLLYAFYHGLLGVGGGSVWFLTLCVYYCLLGAMRFAVTICALREGAGERFAVRLSGALLLLLSLVLAGVSYLSLSRNTAMPRGTIPMIAIATYTTVKVTLAVVKAVRWKGDPSPLLSAVRSIGYAEVAASLFTMQRSMIATFGVPGDRGMEIMNMVTGGFVFLFVLCLGLALLRKKVPTVPEERPL